MDRRTQKTQQQLKLAFIDLLREKSFDAITIKDLTTKADINRATFYKHFKDKHDLLAYYEEMLIEDIAKIIDTSAPLVANVSIHEQPTYKTLVHVYRYVLEEKEFIEVLIGPNGNQSFLIHIQYLLEKMLKQNLLNDKQHANTALPMDYFVVYQASAHLGIMRHWLMKPNAYTPEQMAEMLMSILMNGPFQLT